MVRKLFRAVGSRFRGAASRARQSTTKSISAVRTTIGKRVTKSRVRKIGRKLASTRKTGAVAKRIQRNKKPNTQIVAVSGQSSIFARMRQKIKLPFSRDGKRSQNAPSIFEKFRGVLPNVIPKFPKIFKTGLPFVGGLMGLAGKIPKFGFPKFKLPDVGGFFKQKTGDITDSLSGIFDSIKGKAGDFKEKRDRKKMIRRIVLAVIAIFIGMLIWKKVK